MYHYFLHIKLLSLIKAIKILIPNTIKFGWTIGMLIMAQIVSLTISQIILVKTNLSSSNQVTSQINKFLETVHSLRLPVKIHCSARFSRWDRIKDKQTWGRIKYRRWDFQISKFTPVHYQVGSQIMVLILRKICFQDTEKHWNKFIFYQFTFCFLLSILLIQILKFYWLKHWKLIYQINRFY